MATLNGTFVAMRRALGSSWSANMTQGLAGAVYTSPYYYVTEIEFKTPSFSTASAMAIFVLNLVLGSGSESSVTLRYAICSSNANRNNYCNKYSAVTDGNQITSGTATFTDLIVGTAKPYNLFVDTSELESNTTYYLYLWSTVSYSGGNSYVWVHNTDSNPSFVRVVCGTGAKSYLGCTPIVMDRAHDSAWTDKAHEQGLAGSRYSSPYYYTTEIEFRTPSFSGVASEIEFVLGLTDGAKEEGEVTLRYAVCSSNANRNKYCSTYNAVTDSNQIASGTVTFSDLSTTKVTINNFTTDTSGMNPNATYYLYLWASTPAGSSGQYEYLTVQNIGYTSIIIAYNSSVIYIDNGSSFDAYEIYIDNGSSWDLYQAYIDNGSSWDVCG